MDFIGPRLESGRRYSTNCPKGTRRARGASHACVSAKKRTSKKRRSSSGRKACKRGYRRSRSTGRCRKI